MRGFDIEGKMEVYDRCGAWHLSIGSFILFIEHRKLYNTNLQGTKI